MQTWHLHIEGIVQGVGFRPFVYALALEQGIKGWVNNTIDGVNVVFNAKRSNAEFFKNNIIEKAPRLSQITNTQLSLSETKFFDNFQIIHSAVEGKPNLLLTPDFALCEDCRKEIHNPDNLRAGYAFTTCTNCGPRYSIINQLPYDRVGTEMAHFEMCPTCTQEYNDPSDRRYYSQTNSCPDCGIQLALYQANQQLISDRSEEIINTLIQHWENGAIIAIKGIGGYLLTCDANNDRAVTKLRSRKNRPTKPFALMAPWSLLEDIGQQEPNAWLEWTSPVSPIVLVEKNASLPISKQVAPQLDKVGFMAPYTPLYELLLSKFGKPIVATSGNVSASPIVFEDALAFEDLSAIADFILVNDRKIVVPQDDSVVQYSNFKNQKIILRRSRGLAPSYINAALHGPQTSVLAMGAMLKSTFCLRHQNNWYISPYVGNLEHFDTQQTFQKTLQHYLGLLKTIPEYILVDEHPAYPSTQLGEEYAQDWSIPRFSVQHHKAHFAAILGEHNLLNSKSPILGIIWDGTGIGDDQQIWGGEFFTYQDYSIERATHIEYFDFILGDKMPKEPRISALAICHELEGIEQILAGKFSKTEWKIYQKMLQQGGKLKSSSMGRLFDAVAALLDIKDKQSFEGEAAMQLENLATQYCKMYGLHFSGSYFKSSDIQNGQISIQGMLSCITKDIIYEVDRAFIAAKFHYSLVQLVQWTAENLKIKQIAFSGGVFQNGLLVDLLVHHLPADWQLFFHQQLSPNDENISFGQVIYYHIQNQKEAITQEKTNKNVFSDTRKNQIHRVEI
ncbi:MAG: carbamoyltransferase HypF [Bacteroidota bacterium]